MANFTSPHFCQNTTYGLSQFDTSTQNIIYVQSNVPKLQIPGYDVGWSNAHQPVLQKEIKQNVSSPAVIQHHQYESPQFDPCLLCNSQKPVKVPSKFMIGHISHHLNYLPIKCTTCNQSFGSFSVFEWHINQTEHPEKYIVDKVESMHYLIQKLYNVMHSISSNNISSSIELIELNHLIDNYLIQLTNKKTIKTLQKVVELIKPYLLHSAPLEDSDNMNNDEVVLESNKNESTTVKFRSVTGTVQSLNLTDNIFDAMKQQPASTSSTTHARDIMFLSPKEEPHVDICFSDIDSEDDFNPDPNDTDIDVPLFKFNCSLCPFNSQNQQYFNRHLGRTLHKLNMEKVRVRFSDNESRLNNTRCGFCQFIGATIEDLAEHVLSDHFEDSKDFRKECTRIEKPKLYQCDQCSKSFVQSCDMVRHMRRIHWRQNREPKTRPKDVEKISESKHVETNIGYTYSINASPNFRYKCNKCNVTKNNKVAIVCHVVVHSSAKPFKCRICLSTFKREKALNRHTQYSCHGRSTSIQQSQCTEKESPPSNYRHPKAEYKELETKRFMIEANDGKSTKWYKCNNCKYRTSTPSQLSKHQVVHSSDRPFKCYTCSTSFKRTGDLRRHQVKSCGWMKKCKINYIPQNAQTTSAATLDDDYSGSKMYNCANCNFSTKFNSLLTIHKNKHFQLL